MQTGGLVVMLLSICLVTVLFVWCIVKVLTQPAAEDRHLHGTELHTPDMDRT